MDRLLFGDAPQAVRDFLVYMETIRGKSSKTVEEYFFDLRTFFRFIKQRRGMCPKELTFEEITVSDISNELISSITLSDIYEYMLYIKRERDNSAPARSRKVSSLRSFYKYACDKAGIVKNNPTINLELPKKPKTLPKYLSLEESIELLSDIDGENRERNYCIITLFLNCGLRLSELVGLNLNDIHHDTGSMTVTGKGNKQRNIYLNKACLDAIEQYKSLRPNEGVKDKNALFLSRLKSRISPKTVQWIVKKYLDEAGLSGKGYSTHKLRHTAATLMYQQGGVDIRVLQGILGHESLATTQIYTHVSSEQEKEAIASSPLANFKIKKKTSVQSNDKKDNDTSGNSRSSLEK